MKYTFTISMNPWLLGGRLSLQGSLGTRPICHCISVWPHAIPEEYQPLYSSRGEMAASNLMPPGVRKWPVAIKTV